MPTTPDNATDATPLGEALKTYEAQGYTGQLAAQEGANVVCFSCHETSPAAEVELAALLRTEGASDPDDMTAVAAVTCPRCGTKGTLVLHYGATAPVEHDEVLSALEDRRAESAIDAGR
ncbi:MAG TPA: hypothetical protein VFQ85_03560 [Mycobacteriales bacterium]|nr:hypothetical protein [Mycobacteriales bacterium]